MLSLLLAAALQGAGDIKTGSDLVSVCQRHQAACDTFIRQTIAGSMECFFTPHETKVLRSAVLKFARKSPQAPATEIIWRIPIDDRLCASDGGAA